MAVEDYKLTLGALQLSNRIRAAERFLNLPATRGQR
jgi:hypothetical protein